MSSHAAEHGGISCRTYGTLAYNRGRTSYYKSSILNRHLFLFKRVRAGRGNLVRRLEIEIFAFFEATLKPCDNKERKGEEQSLRLNLLA